MELNSGPVNCLLCLKSLQTHRPLKWQYDEFVEGIASACCTTVNNQLSVIFLLRNLLKIPAVVCGELLESYGDPYFWISCCDSCSVIVDKGRQIFNQIEVLQKQLEKVQEMLKFSICNSGELFSNCDNAAKGSTWTVRSYIKNEMQNDNAEGDASISVEVDQAQLHDNSPLDYENGRKDITDVKLELESLSYSPQRKNNLDITSDENMMDVKPNFETVPEIWVRSGITDNNSNEKEFNSHVDYTTEDLNIPPTSTSTAFQEQVISNQLKLLTEVRELKEIVLRNSAGPPIQLQPENRIRWPLSTIQDFTNCEASLKDEKCFKTEVHIFAHRGGSSISKTVNNILKDTVAHELALDLRFTNTSGKTAFRGTELSRLVKEAVRIYYQADHESTEASVKLNTTEDKLDSLIAKWLRDSVGRGQDRRKRRKKMENSSSNQDPDDSETTRANPEQD